MFLWRSSLASVQVLLGSASFLTFGEFRLLLLLLLLLLFVLYINGNCGWKGLKGVYKLTEFNGNVTDVYCFKAYHVDDLCA